MYIGRCSRADAVLAPACSHHGARRAPCPDRFVSRAHLSLSVSRARMYSKIVKIDSTTTTSRQTPADTTQAQHEEIYSKYMQVKKGLHCHTLDSE